MKKEYPDMMILHFTNKAFKKFEQKPKLIEVDKAEKDFGEWYVNTADSFKRGNLFMTVMHTDSLYTMLVPVEKKMDLSDFVHTVFSNLMLRLLRLDIPQESVEQIIKSYDGQAVFSKTKSRSLVGNLSNIFQDIEKIVGFFEDISYGNQLDMARLECKVNDTPKALNGEIIRPLEMFYLCIRNLCPKLPKRIPMPFDMLVRRNGTDMVTEIFQGRVSEKLLLKVRGSAFDAEVLFNYEEVQALMNAVNDSSRIHSTDNSELYAHLKRMLYFRIQRLSMKYDNYEYFSQ